jgi:peptidoglycan/xylan/chitin deacetylase (PgdA/CDA1 family)
MMMKIPSSNLMFDDGYKALCDPLSAMRRERFNKIFVFLVAGRVGLNNDWDSGGELAGFPLMGWEEIRSLQQQGVAIGSHGMTHKDLRNLTEGQLAEEITGSKKIIEDKLGCLVEGFAYPYGLYNERVIASVKDAGYSWAVTTTDNCWEGRGNPFRMGRTELRGDDSAWKIRVKMSSLNRIKDAFTLPGLLIEKMTSRRGGPVSDDHR